MTLVLLVAMPLAAAIVLLVGATRAPRAVVGVVTVAAPAFALGVAVALGQAFAAGKTELVADLGPWLPIRGSSLALFVEAREIPLLLTLTGAATLVAIAAVREPSGRLPARSIVAFELLLASVLAIVVARDLVLLLVAFGLSGVSASMLISSSGRSAQTARDAAVGLILTRVGDACLLLAALGALALFQTVDIAQIAARLALITLTPPALGALFAVSVLVIVAAGTRCGLAPLHAWLPASSGASSWAAAPVHALAMAAGPILLLRLGGVMHGDAVTIVSALGSATAIFAASASIADPDARRWRATATFGAAIALLPASAFASELVLLAAVFASVGRTIAPATRAARIADATATSLILAMSAALAFGRPGTALALAVATFIAAIGVLRAPAAAAGMRGGTVTYALAVLGYVAALIVSAAALTGAVSLGVPRVLPTDAMPAVMAIAALAVGALVGATSLRLPRPLAELSSDAVRLHTLPELTARSFRGAAEVIERGGDGLVDAVVRSVASAAAAMSRAARRVGTGSEWTQEAMLIAIAGALVVFWIAR